MIKIGVVGCGYWGSKHARVFQEIPEAQLAMICDSRPERLTQIQNIYPNLEAVQSFDELLDSDVDGVVIATPPGTHYGLVREALSRGKHVLVEKPLTTSSAEAEALIEIAEAKGTVLMVGHTYQYNPAVEFIKEYVASGQLGELYYIDSARLNLGLFQSDVDVIWDLAPHDLSILLTVLGKTPMSVSACGVAHIRPELCEVAYLDLVFPERVMAHVHVSWLDPCKVRKLTLVGSEKMVVFDDLSETEQVRIYNKGVVTASNGEGMNQFPVDYRYGEVFIPYIPRSEPLKRECTDFVECIRDGSRPRSDGRIGVEVVRILEMAQQSLRNGSARAYFDGSVNGLQDKKLLEVIS